MTPKDRLKKSGSMVTSARAEEDVVICDGPKYGGGAISDADIARAAEKLEPVTFRGRPVLDLSREELLVALWSACEEAGSATPEREARSAELLGPDWRL